MKTLLKAFMNKLEEWWVTYGFSEKGREGKLKIAAFTRGRKEIVSLGARQRDYLSINNCLAWRLHVVNYSSKGTAGMEPRAYRDQGPGNDTGSSVSFIMALGSQDIPARTFTENALPQSANGIILHPTQSRMWVKRGEERWHWGKCKGSQPKTALL